MMMRFFPVVLCLVGGVEGLPTNLRREGSWNAASSFIEIGAQADADTSLVESSQQLRVSESVSNTYANGLVTSSTDPMYLDDKRICGNINALDNKQWGADVTLSDASQLNGLGVTNVGSFLTYMNSYKKDAPAGNLVLQGGWAFETGGTINIPTIDAVVETGIQVFARSLIRKVVDTVTGANDAATQQTATQEQDGGTGFIVKLLDGDYMIDNEEDIADHNDGYYGKWLFQGNDRPFRLLLNVRRCIPLPEKLTSDGSTVISNTAMASDTDTGNAGDGDERSFGNVYTTGATAKSSPLTTGIENLIKNLITMITEELWTKSGTGGSSTGSNVADDEMHIKLVKGEYNVDKKVNLNTLSAGYHGRWIMQVGKKADGELYSPYMVSFVIQEGTPIESS